MLAGAEDDGLLAYDAATGAWIDPPGTAALFDEREIETLSGPVHCRSALRRLADAAAEWPPGRVAGETGVPEEALAHAADLLFGSGTVAYYAWNGVGQSVTATQTDRAISILYALTGHYGAEGGNIPGGAAAFNDISGQNLLSDAQRAKALGLRERPIGPGGQGWVTARDAYRAMLTGKPYTVRMLVSFGGNLLSAQPDSRMAREALSRLDFHVHADFFLNATAEHADIVLPVATSWEREGLRTGFDASLDGLRRVQLRPAVIDRVGQARSDTDIVLALSRRLGLSPLMFDCDADEGHAHVLAPSGVTLDALRAAPEGVTLPSAVRRRAYLQSGFPTPTRRIEIYSEQLLGHGQHPVPALREEELPRAGDGFPLRLGCAKTVAYCHSQGRNIPSLRRLAPDPVVEMSPEAAGPRGIAEGDWVEIATRAGRFAARARIVAGAEPGSVFAQHGWTVADAAPASLAGGDRLGANMNRAVPTDRADPVSGSIPLRCSWCEVRRLDAHEISPSPITPPDPAV
jgi:anaerobic selenocysteine-containing dehydrogenase